MKKYDVVVVGGGAAGLSGAVALARSRRSVLVVDAGEPRNAPAGHVHNYLGREGTPPAELLAIGRSELAGYGGEVMNGTVTSITRHEDGEFTVQPAGEPAVRARRLLVTTGLKDELPEVAGLARRFGRDVLHCPYCHGWEVRDQAIGVLATSPMSLHQAQMWRQLSDDVIVFRHTAPAFDVSELAELAARGIRVVDGAVAAIEVSDDRLSGVRLESGEVVAREALAIAPRFAARAELLAPLGLTVEDVELNGHVLGTQVPTGESGATAVPGLWLAGNVTNMMAQVSVSASAGLAAGAAINRSLIEEEVAEAVRRSGEPDRTERAVVAAGRKR
ncbi:NAD(P)/FAD-dependent oxidoreductase [Amycolatopsis panacis]|uniref:NAD(P)/FAD-dependent oxidoreductase n=1 Tax=Amycolatopsis panacis TaxID=2340917 RepID=A0A419IAF0_9PSEU|nr:NAD(P)/FAD-dependent oxidoreductase [Amycolatopsis panacis]RJQ90021.1 NAD(P)/FAD-dependent oxidoreductase [Amycolatopsis panacis]